MARPRAKHLSYLSSFLFSGLWSVIIAHLLFFITPVLVFNIDVTNTPYVFSGPKDSYFGYSVALIENTGGKWLLAGAPRGDDTAHPSIPQPGVLYKCPVQRGGRCEQVLVDTKGNERVDMLFDGRNITFKHDKNNSWLGVSIDTSGDYVLACSHRWKDQLYLKREDHLFMNGLCYEMPADLDSRHLRLIPALINSKKQVENGTLNYGMGAMGMSARYSQNKKDLMLGAPGVEYWTGGVVEAKDDGRVSIITHPRSQANESELIGYAVGSGYFYGDNKLYYVAGGPRTDNLGKVFVFQSSLVEPVAVIQGEQMGSYFGSALVVTDVDNDGIDELIVGAPMFSNTMDEGRVYVYSRKDPLTKEMSLKQEPLFGSNMARSRFGTALAALGDLNKDGFNDIAVGAPYEDDLRGAVYIYNGYRYQDTSVGGLWKNYTQKILASQLGLMGMSGFGVSFSRPLDADGNGFNDVAVGAYLADKTVLLHTKPVINMNTTVEVTPEVIDMDRKSCSLWGNPAPCMEIKLCFQYKGGPEFPEQLEVTYTINVDTSKRDTQELERVLIEQGETTTETDTRAVFKNFQRTCSYAYTVLVKPVRDIVTPVVFEAEISISGMGGFSCVNKPCPQLTLFDGNHPDDAWRAIVKRKVTFKKDCGHDDRCDAILTLAGSVIFETGSAYVILRKSATFTINVRLLNTGEPAYDSLVTIAYPKNVRYIRTDKISGDTDVKCTPKYEFPSPTAQLECDVGNPLLRTPIDLNIVLSIGEGVVSGDFHVTVSAATKSSGRRPESIQLSVPVKSQVQIEVVGASDPAFLLTKKETDDTKYSWQNFVHVFDLQNRGPSPLPTVGLTIRVPEIFHNGEQLLYIGNFSMEGAGGRPLSNNCSLPLSSPKESDSQGYSNHVTGNPVVINVERNIRNIDCSTDPCTPWSCSVGPVKADDIVAIKIGYFIKNDILSLLDVEKKLVVTSTLTTQLPMRPDLIIISQQQQSSPASTDVHHHKRISDQQVAWWVVLLSVLGALAIIAIIVLVLFKIGFFRRKQQEELMKRKDAEGQKMVTIGETEVDGLDEEGAMMHSAEKRHQ